MQSKKKKSWSDIFDSCAVRGVGQYAVKKKIRGQIYLTRAQSGGLVSFEEKLRFWIFAV